MEQERGRWRVPVLAVVAPVSVLVAVGRDLAIREGRELGPLSLVLLG